MLFELERHQRATRHPLPPAPTDAASSPDCPADSVSQILQPPARSRARTPTTRSAVLHDEPLYVRELYVTLSQLIPVSASFQVCLQALDLRRPPPIVPAAQNTSTLCPLCTHDVTSRSLSPYTRFRRYPVVTRLSLTVIRRGARSVRSSSVHNQASPGKCRVGGPSAASPAT